MAGRVLDTEVADKRFKPKYGLETFAKIGLLSR